MNDIDYIKKNLEFKKDFIYYLDYLVYVFPLALLILGAMITYNVFKFEHYNILWLGLLLIAFSVLLYFFTKTRLSDNLTFVSEDIGDNQIDINVLGRDIKENLKLKNIIIDSDKKFIKAYTKWTAFSWGEEITIILDYGRILINSRPSSVNQPGTIYKDKQNIKQIKQLIKMPSSQQQV